MDTVATMGAAAVWLLVVPLAALAPREPAADVLVENYAFEPTAVTVVVGETVRWTLGDDPEQHTVTPVDLAAFDDSGQLFRGDTFEVTFEQPGTWAYLCTLHPTMTGTVTILATASSAPEPSPSPVPTSTPEPAATDPVTPSGPVVEPDSQTTSSGSVPVAVGVTLAAAAVIALAAMAIRRRRS